MTMPEDTARRLAEIREAFDCSVADYGMDPGDTGFLLGIIDAQRATIDAHEVDLEDSYQAGYRIGSDAQRGLDQATIDALTAERDARCGNCGGDLRPVCVACGTRHGYGWPDLPEPDVGFTAGDRVRIGPTTAEATVDRADDDRISARVDALSSVNDRLVAVVRDLVDDEPCSYDHHGGCQTHGYLSLEAEEACPQAVARELLAVHDA